MKTKNDTLNAIQTMVDNAVSNAGFNSTRNAVILARNANNTYKIKMDGVEYDNVISYGTGQLSAGEVGKVVIPNGQASQMFLLIINPVVINPYPIGSIYQTSDATFNPATYFGGTWEKIEGRFLIGASNSIWVKIATESEAFTLNTQCTCKWGVGDPMTATTYYQKTLAAGTYTANTTTFDGQDPASGNVKEVYVLLEFGTKQGETNHTLNVYEMPSHTHTYSYSYSPYHTGASGSARYVGNEYANAGTTGAGASYTHTNMPPYEVVIIWKRTA